MLILKSFIKYIFIVKQTVFVILLIISLTYIIIITYLFVLTVLFLTPYIDMRETIFLIFNLKTFFKKYARSSSVTSHSKSKKISFFSALRFGEYRILKITYFQLRVTSVFYILNKATFSVKLFILNITRLNLTCLDRGIYFYINVFFLCTYFLLT